jgi:hypothetical protein
MIHCTGIPCPQLCHTSDGLFHSPTSLMLVGDGGNDKVIDIFTDQDSKADQGQLLKIFMA